MPDWQKLVSERLWSLELESQEWREVIEELAVHLEESCQRFRREGFSEDEAVRQTLVEVNDWSDLGRRIESARMGRKSMTNRVKQLWLPGLLTLALTIGLLSFAPRFSFHPIILSLAPGAPFLRLYPSWLMLLPLAGAIGAYLSKRAGGSLRMVLLSSLFPVLLFVVVFMIVIPAGLLIAHSISNQIIARAFLNMTVGWVLAPGMVLLAGGLLVQLLVSRGLLNDAANS